MINQKRLLIIGILVICVTALLIGCSKNSGGANAPSGEENTVLAFEEEEEEGEELELESAAQGQADGSTPASNQANGSNASVVNAGKEKTATTTQKSNANNKQSKNEQQATTNKKNAPVTKTNKKPQTTKGSKKEQTTTKASDNNGQKEPETTKPEETTKATKTTQGKTIAEKDGEWGYSQSK